MEERPFMAAYPARSGLGLKAPALKGSSIDIFKRGSKEPLFHLNAVIPVEWRVRIRARLQACRCEFLYHCHSRRCRIGRRDVMTMRSRHRSFVRTQGWQRFVV